MLTRVTHLLGLVGLMILATASVTFAQEIEGREPLKAVAEAMLAGFVAEPPKEIIDRFSEDFLKSVPPPQLLEYLKNVHKSAGKATGYRLVRMTQSFAGEIEYIMEKGYRLPALIQLEEKPPHKIVSFTFRGLIKDYDSFDQLGEELKLMPGTVGVAVMRLGKSQEMIWEHNGDKPLAIASCFKLFLLATLNDQFEKQERKWEDVVPVRRDWASLPGGTLQDWPDGAPITLHSLATLMISRSDNTAADHLHHILGREKIEALQHRMGVKSPERNRPFLRTGEMFRIKLVLSPEEQQEYVTANEPKRREILDTVVKPKTLVNPRPLGEPRLIDSVEWFYSPTDLCRSLDWMRRRPQPDPLLGILAVNQAVPTYIDKTHWTYIGYKGGAERGVLCFTLLLKSKDGEWFAVAAAWNNPDKDVDHAKLIGVTQQLIRLAQKVPPK